MNCKVLRQPVEGSQKERNGPPLLSSSYEASSSVLYELEMCEGRLAASKAKCFSVITESNSQSHD